MLGVWIFITDFLGLTLVLYRHVSVVIGYSYTEHKYSYNFLWLLRNDIILHCFNGKSNKK